MLQLAFFHVRGDDKPAVLLHLLRSVVKPQDQTVVFVATKHHTEYLKEVSGIWGCPWGVCSCGRSLLESLPPFHRIKGEIPQYVIVEVLLHSLLRERREHSGIWRSRWPPWSLWPCLFAEGTCPGGIQSLFPPSQLLTAQGIRCTHIYSSLDQTARKINIAKFSQGKCPVLLVTDVAARGLDIPMLDNVINFSFPAKAKLFLHRVGGC